MPSQCAAPDERAFDAWFTTAAEANRAYDRDYSWKVWQAARASFQAQQGEAKDAQQAAASAVKKEDWAALGYVAGATVEQDFGPLVGKQQAIIRYVHANGALDVTADNTAYGWSASRCKPVGPRQTETPAPLSDEPEKLTIIHDALSMSNKLFEGELTDWRLKQVQKAMRLVKALAAAGSSQGQAGAMEQQRQAFDRLCGYWMDRAEKAERALVFEKTGCTCVNEELAEIMPILDNEWQDWLRAKFFALSLDAERYRWLRDISEPGICAFYLSVGQAFHGVRFARETVDEAIDAQIVALAARETK
jgi:hypothetical protein